MIIRPATRHDHRAADQSKPANARSSTDPRTERGKAHASRCALRHGLSIPVLSDPDLAKRVEDLARKIVGKNASPVLLELARAIAEAQIDLDRVRATRHELIARIPGDADLECQSLGVFPNLPFTRRETGSSIAWRYSSKDFIKNGSQKVVNAGKRYGAEQFAAILSDRVFTLKCLDRYERRVRSRRKSATRAFDAARVEGGDQQSSE
jgi:hypothetical protein